jgi:ribosome-binding factor A
MMIQEVQDPRLEGVFVTDVTVDRELAFADVFVSALEGSERSAEVIEGLQHAGGYLRSELARRVELRNMPRLRFHWDATPEHADYIELLLKELNDSTGQAGEEKPPHG